MKNSHKFSALRENIRALDADTQTKRWMYTRPQMCWKCQKDKPLKGGEQKFFGGIKRFICVDCMLAKQVELARAKGESK